MTTSYPPGFTHLRVHSYYTLLGATPSIEELTARAQEEQLEALALTDRDALYGAVKFHKACIQRGILPILGMEVQWTGFSGESDFNQGDAGTLVLLAADPSGYRSLCALSSAMLGDPHRKNTLLTWEELRSYPAGLFCVEAGRDGFLHQLLRVGDEDGGGRYLARLGGLFGERLFVGLEIQGETDQAICRSTIDLAQRFGLQGVALQPLYTLRPEDRANLQLLTAIRDNRPIDTRTPPKFPSGAMESDLHWLGPEAMRSRFEHFPQALENVRQITQRCVPALPTGSPIWPVLAYPAGRNASDDLEEQALAGAASHFGGEPSPFVQDRLASELKALRARGYCPLFLVVADIVRFAREAQIPVSTRGSVANSLVAYCLGITTVDPIEHELLFERFLSPARADLPDIDLDFCSRRRDEVLHYVRNKYGPSHVALVATINTMGPRSALGESGKALGISDARLRDMVKMLPRHWHPDPRRRSHSSLGEALGQLKNDRERQLVMAATKLVGYPRHLSVHPGGVVITPGPLSEYLPVQWAPKGFLITQYDHSDLEEAGFPKVDILGIRALTVLSDAVAFVRKDRDPSLSWESIPASDPSTEALLQAGDTIGVFQCESEGARRTLRQLKARTVRDLAVANAFFKPGPATGGMAKAFVQRYRGEEPVRYLHPALEPILASTKGVLIFQEQILRVAREIAGLSWEQADQLRRGMSKFQSREMEQLQQRFLEGCTRPPPEGQGFSADQAETLWEQVLAFSGYGFNQGHATAYAQTSYRMAYMKAHWPEAFLCARLADRGGYHHPAIYLAEARRLGIDIHPPHIHASGLRFTLRYESGEGGALKSSLWMGLGQVRDLRRRAIRQIVGERRARPFQDIRDLMQRIQLQAREIQHLIQCGALDGLGPSRAGMLAQVDSIMRHGDQGAFAFMEPTHSLLESAAQRFTWEKRVLGMPLSVHPLQLVREALREITAIVDLPGSRGRQVQVAGTRLPGWTGGAGYFVEDGSGFVIVKSAEERRLQKPVEWEPVKIVGRWVDDEWGGGWLHAEAWEALTNGCTAP